MPRSMYTLSMELSISSIVLLVGYTEHDAPQTRKTGYTESINYNDKLDLGKGRFNGA